MTNPKISILLGSSRPGGVDISLLGLCAQTFDDFEVIFVDGRYHKRHALVLDMVAAFGLKQLFFHVPNHRYTEGPWTTISAGFNTGFALAAGEIAIMLCDYAYAPPGWIEAHLAAHVGGERMVVAPHRYRASWGQKGWEPPLREFAAPCSLEEVVAQRERIGAEEERLAGYQILDPDILSLPIPPFGLNDPKLAMSTGPVDHTYMHTKNESFPLSNILAVNGCDENYDRGRGPGDHDVGRRLIGSGLSGWLASDALVEVVNPRAVMPNPNIAIADESLADYPHRWTVPQGNDYYHRTADRKRANNPFEIEELRANLWLWRELSQHRNAIIPFNVADDLSYFADCPLRWP